MHTKDRGFEWFLRSANRELCDRFGDAFAARVLPKIREEHRLILPKVPDIGGAANVFQPVMTVNGWIVALHLVLRAEGKTAADAVAVSQAVFDGWLRKVPGFVLKVMGRLAMTSPLRRYFEAQARRSQQRRYGEDFVWTLERGADGEVSFVFDECAVNKWYAAQGVEELSPYCNFFDVTYSRLMGMGVDATETIGLGCEQCALRFKHGRPTIVPPTLEGVISGD